MAWYDFLDRIFNRNYEDVNKNYREMKDDIKPEAFSKGRSHNLFKFTIDDVRSVNNRMINGLGIPKDQIKHWVDLTEDDINSAYGRAIQQEIQEL